MDCPICQKPMVVLELNQIEVDHCLSCGGVWLDREEMDLLLEGSTAGQEIRQHITADPTSTEAPRKCPICSKKMEKARVAREGHTESILIDRCTKQHGTWLDGGELQAIVALSEFPPSHRIHEFLSAIFRGPASGSRT